MKLFVVACLISAALADKLDSTYLPPSNARTAGGSGEFLATPIGSAFGSHGGTFGSNFQGPSYSNFGRGGFAGGYKVPAPVYGVPGHHQDNFARAAHNSRPVNIVRYSNENNGDGSYRFEYETQNKISQHEVGQLQNAGSQHEASVVRGSYSYQAPDGQVLTVDYIADENGFQPSGHHLPTPPPIPEAIQRSLERNAAEEAQVSRDGYSGQTSGNSGYQYNPQRSQQYHSASGQAFSSAGYRY